MAKSSKTKASELIPTSPAPGTRGGDRRRRILIAFHDCIINQGYSKTTLRNVAKQAGMTASHLLYYFSGKDAILEHYFANVSERIVERIESFREETPQRQIELLSELFFAGKGITRSEIGFMLECFGAAVHDTKLQSEKEKLDKYCKEYLKELFAKSPCGSKKASDSAELAYAMLIGLRTATYFDQRLELSQTLHLFRNEMCNLAQLNGAFAHENKK